MKASNNILPLLLLLAVAVTAGSCDGDYRKEAQGQFGEAVVVMDSTSWDSETARAVRSTYGAKIPYFQGFEPRYDLTFRDFSSNEELEDLKYRKNLIIASPVDAQTNVGAFVRALLGPEVEQSVRNGESYAFPLENRWYRNQWAIILTSSSDSALASKIRRGRQNIVQSLTERELERWRYEVYDRGEQTGIADSLWNHHGWKIRVQHDYRVHIDTTYMKNGEPNHFFTMQRLLPDNSRRFWAWWQDDVQNINYLDEDWINTKRDSLWKTWIRGTRDSSYVTTDYREQHSTVETRSFELNGDLAHETLGWWRMTNDAMGGPFVTLTVYDDESRRLFMLGYVQFAPKYRKRRFVRQFRAMLRTFESDSTWNSTKPVAFN